MIELSSQICKYWNRHCDWFSWPAYGMAIGILYSKKIYMLALAN